MNKHHLTIAAPSKRRETRENNHLKGWQKVKLEDQSSQLPNQ